MHPTSLHLEEKYRSEYENKSKNEEVNMTTKNNFKIACPAILIVKLLLDGRSNAVQMPVNPYEGGASSARLRPQQGKITPIAATT